MYALIETSGQQFQVREGDTLTVDLRPEAAGTAITFDRVLLLSGEHGVTVGTPTVANAKVTGEVIEHKKGPKVVSFKMRRRQNYRKKVGFRADHTEVRITGIVAGGEQSGAEA